MRRRLTMMVATTAMVAMMAANAGAASAAALANGKGGEKASPNASFGIATAIANTQKHDDCTIC
jgi:hypothetical protein